MCIDCGFGEEYRKLLNLEHQSMACLCNLIQTKCNLEKEKLYGFNIPRNMRDTYNLIPHVMKFRYQS